MTATVTATTAAATIEKTATATTITKTATAAVTTPATTTTAEDDFNWTDQEEPHKTRRMLILKKHPEIKKLMGHDSTLLYKVTVLVLLQSISAWLMREQGWGVLLVGGYVWGGVWNHSLALAIHEICHNLAFGHQHPILNRLLGLFANLPMAVPYSISFRKYHLEHHKFQGDERRDVDLPTNFEAAFFKGTLAKAVWLVLQPFFYVIRPLICHPKPPNHWDFFNLVTQMAYNCLVYRLMGATSLIYLLLSSFLSMGLHPMAGHFVSEHYSLTPGQETFSYYGVLNKVAFNVGYHNEHHDFPNIPGCRLPHVREIASEFYEDLISYTSWTAVLWRFVMDPSVSLYCRVKRKGKAV